MLLNDKLVSAIEVFVDAPDVQYCENVTIRADLPFSEIEFNRTDFFLAAKVTGLKALGGFNDENDVEIFLNNEKINKKDLMFWNDEESFELFLKKENKFIKEKNKFIIEFINSDNYVYFKQILVYTQENEDDLENLTKELDRWKNFYKQQ